MLNFIIDDGIMEIRMTMTRPEDAMKLEGGIEGFESCRGKEPGQIMDLLSDAAVARVKAMEEGADDYWRLRMKEAQIEYTAAVLSVALRQLGLPTIVPISAKAQLRYLDIVGFDENR